MDLMELINISVISFDQHVSSLCELVGLCAGDDDTEPGLSTSLPALPHRQQRYHLSVLILNNHPDILLIHELISGGKFSADTTVRRSAASRLTVFDSLLLLQLNLPSPGAGWMANCWRAATSS